MIGVERHERTIGDRVRVAPYAHGERTDTDVQDRLAVVVDQLQTRSPGARMRYFLRFVRPDSFGTADYFFDWVYADELRDH